MSQKFTSNLLQWYRDHPRPLPWKADNDPYKTWVSEIIMQQTRVAQGTPYYLRFIEAFSTIDALADAPESKVLKLWEGLGYYSRARNMHYTAKLIQKEYNSVFPDAYDDILKLKGIGPYTAAAIASFSFGLSYPVVDGNVLRTISRYFRIEKSIDDTQTKKEITRICEDLIRDVDPAEFNQAIMNFGATQCVPRNPECTTCYLSKNCKAYKKGDVSTIPVRSKKVKQRNRYFQYYVIVDGEHMFLRQRKGKDIWKGLYEFPMIEKDEEWKVDLKKDLAAFLLYKGVKIIGLEGHQVFKQKLTHQTIYAKFIMIEITKPVILEKEEIIRVKQDKIENYSFPKTILNYLKGKSQTTLF